MPSAARARARVPLEAEGLGVPNEKGGNTTLADDVSGGACSTDSTVVAAPGLGKSGCEAGPVVCA